MQVFDEIYKSDKWNGPESRSGPGSGLMPTRRMNQELRDFVKERDVKSVLDVACGDNHWLSEMPDYLGVDVSRVAVELARKAHPLRKYIVLDAVRDNLPEKELVLCRDCMQHLPLEDIRLMVANIRDSGCKWLAASTFTDGENIDIRTGDAFRPDLSKLGLGDPVWWIQDGYSYEVDEDIPSRDVNKYLGIWSMP